MLQSEKMIIDKGYVEAFETLGLTRTEAKVYMALVGLGKTDARTIWKNSGVVRQNIYRILAELEGKGLVEKILNAPTAYRALPIQDAFAILLKTKAHEYKRIEKKIKELLNIQKVKHEKKTIAREYEFTLVATKRQSLYRLGKTMENTTKSIEILDSWKSFKRAATTYADFHIKAAKRNIKCRVVTDKPKKGEHIPEIIRKLKKTGCFEIRHIRTRPATAILVSDKKEVGICTEAAKYAPEAPSLVSNDPTLLAIIQDYFEMLWNKTTKDST